MKAAIFPDIWPGDKEFSKVNTKVLLEVRGKKHPASVCGLPFYKKSYVKGVN